MKEFAGHVERVQALKAKQKALIKNTNVVDELHRLLGNYGVRISSEDMVQLDDLRGVQESYRNETEAVDAFVQSRVWEMIQQLNANIQRLDEQVLQLNSQLQTGVFIDPDQFEDPSHVKSEPTPHTTGRAVEAIHRVPSAVQLDAIQVSQLAGHGRVFWYS